MNGPRRLLEQGADDFERELLASSRLDRGSEEAMSRVLAAAGVGAALVAGSTAAAAGASTQGAAASAFKAFLGSAVAKWTIASVVVASVGAGSVVVATHSSRSSASAPVTAPAASSQHGPSSVPTLERPSPVASEPDLVAPSPEVPTSPAPRAPGTARAPSSVDAPERDAGAPEAAAGPERSDDLRAEVAAVDTARRAIEAGRNADGLLLLDNHQRQFPRSRFQPEVVLLRVQALVALGRRSQAIGVARAHLEQAPDSPVAARLQAMFAELLPPPDPSIP